jgi:hypothetical protein
VASHAHAISTSYFTTSTCLRHGGIVTSKWLQSHELPDLLPMQNKTPGSLNSRGFW